MIGALGLVGLAAATLLTANIKAPTARSEPPTRAA